MCMLPWRGCPECGQDCPLEHIQELTIEHPVYHDIKKETQFHNTLYAASDSGELGYIPVGGPGAVPHTR